MSGGAAFIDVLVTKLTGCHFEQNSARNGGSLYSTNQNVVTIVSSLFRASSAVLNGGAIDSDGDLTIQNSVCTSNSAGVYGGCIYSDNVLALQSVHFDLNFAVSEGGAVVCCLCFSSHHLVILWIHVYCIRLLDCLRFYGNCPGYIVIMGFFSCISLGSDRLPSCVYGR